MLRYGTLVVLAVLSSALWAQTPPYGGYTNATYSTGTTYGDQIESFVLKMGTTTLMQNLNTGGAASPYNTFYSSITPGNLVPGTSHTVELLPGSAYSQYFTAFIDYNNDGDFADSGETLGTTGNITNPTWGIITFTPPTGVGGVRRLRTMAVYATTGPHSATGSYSYGEVEDYLVNLGFAIATASPLPTGAVNTAYNTTITATNGTTPYNWVTPVSPLPTGLSASISGNNLVISGTPTVAGTTNFTVTCNDSSTTPQQSQKAFSITIVPPPAAMPFTDNFGTDKGWQYGTHWTRGTATAYSNTGPPRTEPGTDYTTSTTDNQILGTNIGADYPTGIGTATWAISPMVNCASAANVRVRFARWLGISIGDVVKVQVTNNGTNWVDVYTNPTTSNVNDTAWTVLSYDISATAAGNATVQVRFGLGPNTGTVVNTGWCIDDFEIFEAGPDMEVREGGVTGTLINDNQTVGGLRNFGSVTIGQQSTPLTIAITNNGTSSITIGAFTKSGTNPADFTYQAGSMTNPLPVGQTTTFTIIFYVATGGTPGTKSATISFAHNAPSPAGGSFEINVTGNAVSPAPGVIQVREVSATGTIVTFQQAAAGTARDFGNRDINAGPTATLTIFVVNTGAGNLTLSLPVMGGTWWNQYVLDTTGFSTSLAPAASTSFTVAFDPNTVQSPCDALVRIAHNDTTQTTPFDVPVTGNGTTTPTTPTLEVHQGTATGPTINHNDPAATTPRDFGNQVVTAGPTAAITITIVNGGTQTLTLSTPTKGGTQAGEFVLTTTGFSTSLAGAASTSFTVAFDPTSTGAKTATINFTHNDTTKTSPFIINVMGNGVTSAPIIGVKIGGATGTTYTSGAPATGALDFGNRDIAAGASTAVQIYIENTGTVAMTLGAPTLGGTAASEFVLDTTGFTTSVAVGANTSFTVAFDPSTVGLKNASISFTHNATASATSPFVVNVRGTGILNSPVVEVREGTTTGATVASSAAATAGGGRDLGSIDVGAGATAAKTIVILNTGTQSLTLGTPTLTGADAAMFTLNTTGFTATVAAAGNTQFSVTFDPTLVGIRDANIQFTHNDTSAPSPYIVPIRGEGTSATGVSISTSSLPAGDAGKIYSAALAATQGTAPYTWSLRSGTLPTGLTLGTAGDITGTPAAGGIFNITIRVTDAGGNTNDRAFTLAVNGGTLFKKSTIGGGSCEASNSGSPALLALAALALAALGMRLRKRTAR